MSKHRESGHLVERSPGHWAIVISVRDPATGKRKREWHSFKGSAAEAKAERRRLLSALDSGTAIDPRKMKLATYLQEWLRTIKDSVSPRTYERYSEIVASYLIPALGNMILSKLDKFVIADAYVRIRGMRTKGAGELSPTTILHCHRVLSAALKEAVPRHLSYNPTTDAKRPKVERRKIATYNYTETVDVLDALRGSWMHVPALLAAMCGMREGEIAALRWRGVDLDKGRLAVIENAEETKKYGVRYKEPKSGQARTMALSPAVVAELRAHRVRQAEALLRIGTGLNDDCFVVAQADGSAYKPSSISKEWRLRIIKSGLRRIKFHELRHTHGSHMLASNVHPKIASERLGHSRVGITLDLYSHVVEGLQENAVALVDDAMAKALENRTKGVG